MLEIQMVLKIQLFEKCATVLRMRPSAYGVRRAEQGGYPYVAHFQQVGGWKVMRASFVMWRELYKFSGEVERSHMPVAPTRAMTEGGTTVLILSERQGNIT